MTSNVDTSVQQVQQEFQALIAYVIGPETRDATAYAVELTLFRRLLALGATLLRLFFLTRAAAPHPASVSAPDGTPLGYHDCRGTTYYSVFGKVRFARPYFYAPGQAGCCPLDAALSLPGRCYSDLLRDWMTYGASDESYRENRTMLQRILGHTVSTQALETGIAEAAVDVAAFYERPRAASVGPRADTILVAQADGKGVPMVQSPPGPPVVRRGKGQPRTKKKEAVVTTLYTIAPYRRTAQEVVAALLREDGCEHDRRPGPARPVPVGKELRATLDGKEAALTRLAQRAAQYEGPHIRERVALTDGAEALQQQLRAHFPRHTLVLDIIHAAEYLWDTANALLGETHPHRTAWIRTHLEHLLLGRTATVIAALEAEAANATRTATQRTVTRSTAGYYRRNQPYMRYDVYLERGWPIGTGVIEGACGHLVKDRMEQSGMRWTKAGAQGVLDLRAVRLNGQWDAYWQFHRRQCHQRLYGTPAVAETVEAQVLAYAA